MSFEQPVLIQFADGLTGEVLCQGQILVRSRRPIKVDVKRNRPLASSAKEDRGGAPEDQHDGRGLGHCFDHEHSRYASPVTCGEREVVANANRCQCSRSGCRRKPSGRSLPCYRHRLPMSLKSNCRGLRKKNGRHLAAVRSQSTPAESAAKYGISSCAP